MFGCCGSMTPPNRPHCPPPPVRLRHAAAPFRSSGPKLGLNSGAKLRRQRWFSRPRRDRRPCFWNIYCFKAAERAALFPNLLEATQMFVSSSRPVAGTLLSCSELSGSE